MFLQKENGEIIVCNTSRVFIKRAIFFLLCLKVIPATIQTAKRSPYSQSSVLVNISSLFSGVTSRTSTFG